MTFLSGSTSERPSILYLLPQLVVGGAERQMVLLAGRLRRKGWVVFVGELPRIHRKGAKDAKSGSLRGQGERVNRRATEENDFALRSLRLCGLVYHFPRVSRFDPVPIFEIAALLRARKIRLLHTWLFLDGLYGRLAALPLGVPAVAGVRGVEYDERSLRAFADRALARATAAVVANSGWLARRLAKFGVPRGKIAVVPNGVDVEWLNELPPPDVARGHEIVEGPPPDDESEALRQIGREHVVVGTVGRLHPIKDHATLLRACAIVAPRVPHARFLIAGDGPERERVSRLSAELGLADKVLLVGNVADVRFVLRRVDVFVLTSLSESCPNALLEAMALGLPCISTRVGGVPEIVEEQRSGLLSEAGNPQDIARNLLTLLESKTLRDSLGRNAAQTVRAKFSVEKMVERYERIYERVLEGKPPAGGYGGGATPADEDSPD